MFRKIGVALIGATGAGIVLGAVARVLMMLVRVGVGHASEFTWSGSASIMLTFAVSMFPGALAAAFTRSRWRWSLLVAGAVALLPPALGVAGEEVGPVEHLDALDWALVAPAGAGVFVTIALLPIVTIWLVDMLLRRRTPTQVTPRAGADA